VPRFASSEFDLQFYVLIDVVNIVNGKLRKWGHAALGPAALCDRSLRHFIVFVMEDDDGADQVRPLRTTRAFSP
jgi:hypothetical protein